MPDPPRSADRLPVLALLASNLLLACGPWLVRLARAQGGVGPIAAGFWRLTLALPVLLVALPFLDEPRRPGGRAIGLVAVAGIAFAADLALWHLGILRTRLGNATLFGNITALTFPLYGFVAAHAWPRPRQRVALGLALVGIALLLGRSYQLSAAGAAGDLLCIAAGLAYTAYLVTVGRVGSRVGPVTTLALAVATGIPLLLLAAWGNGEAIRPHAWAPLVALAIGSQLGGQGLVLYAIRRVTPLVLGLMLLIQPLVSATIGWLGYGERLGPLDLLGAAAMVAAMLLVRDDGRPAPLPNDAHTLTLPT